ncbi:hypothetical protein NP233_g12493 [Leucocoprinus birnbaumii]|uniref:Uncharacterized protein n=1 Tax=Leucocoprinus birnbaumii TaxID=56174 RepID=A0AAD5YPY4_9AGAR|nr:hypothetical protein NP233_g12493 [Leucocoprinus birnbaumii]
MSQNPSLASQSQGDRHRLDRPLAPSLTIVSSGYPRPPIQMWVPHIHLVSSLFATRMSYFVTTITVAQAATVINAAITFAQFTISLTLVILLIYLMPKSNTALAWSSISRSLQSSLWPVILRTDSQSSRSGGAAVATISLAGAATTGLVALAGILLPLGLSEGPIIPSNFRQVDAQYIADNSPVALATTPDRGSFIFGRTCGSIGPKLACPGNSNPNDTSLAPQVVEIFNSTPHNPFSMEYRRFFNGGEGPQRLSVGIIGAAETFILRNDTFITEGLIVDMSPDHPGVGFWNQTLPPFQNGATWSQDVLWLEPTTQCVDTNLTVDYIMMDGPVLSADSFNLTDHGGFVNIKHTPEFNGNGQNIDLWLHAYKGATYSNLFAMQFMNVTPETSYLGASYPVNTSLITSLSTGDLGYINPLPISYLNYSSQVVACSWVLLLERTAETYAYSTKGRGGAKASTHARALHAPPSKLSLSTPIAPTISKACKSLVRPLGYTFSRATENVDFIIADIDLLWGRVDDQYENDPSLSTIRANEFYLLAGAASIWNTFPDGQPSSAHARIWAQMYDPLGLSQGVDGKYVTDYSGKADFSIKAKMQSLVALNPTVGNAQIRNLVWTDMMANNVIGTQRNGMLWAADHLRTLQYDLKYAIPGFLLLLIWLPSFSGALFLLVTRSMTFQRMRAVLNHTSVGRVIVGTSALRAHGPSAGYTGVPQPDPSSATSSYAHFHGDKALGHRRNKSDWANNAGKVLVSLELRGHRSKEVLVEEDIKLIDNPRR